RVSMRWRWDDARHLVMRLSLGFVLGWFAVQELRAPSEWAVFVPSFVADASPASADSLILLHGFMLLAAAVAIVLGLAYRAGSLLAVGLLAEIILGLWYDGGGISDLVVRDIGVFGLAVAIALDRSQFLHADDLLARLQSLPPKAAPRWPVHVLAATAAVC